MLKTLPIGTEDFKEVIEKNYYYVDKTLIIEDLLRNGHPVSLLTRPQRFGKTLLISMLDNFFDIEKKETNKDLFKNLKIYKSDYYKYFGTYPVIKLNFKDLKQDNYEEMYEEFKEIIRKLYESKSYLTEVLTGKDKDIFNSFLSKTASIIEYQNSIEFLSNLLYKYYNKKVIILIDEYDVPLKQGYLNNFYNDISSLLIAIFFKSLKGNECLKMSVMTGVLKMNKESVFSDLNNILVYSVIDKSYSEYFGFTEEETKELLNYYNLELSTEVKEMYGGYNFNKVDIYNPWSILNYAKSKELNLYSINDSEKELIMNTMKNVPDETKELIESLITGSSIPFTYNEKLTYLDISTINSITGIINFFLQSGYLTIDKKYGFNINNLYAKIPNDEIKNTLNYIQNK